MRTREIDFAKYSSIKIGSVASVNLISSPTALPDSAVLIGGANNLLISDNPPPLFMLDSSFDYILIKDGELVIGASTKSGKIHSLTKKQNISGFEFLSQLPGTLGGMIAMNAGMKEFEIFDHLKWLNIDGKIVAKSEIDHGYRYAKLGGVVYEAGFELISGYSEELREKFAKMRANQPSAPSAGSCFKNPIGDYAGRLIEAVGLKGFERNGVAFSQKHANFLVNLGSGDFDSAVWLISEAKKRVLEQFGIELECEIKIIKRSEDVCS